MIDKVKIGNQTYPINEVECVERGSSLAGQIRYIDSVIRIDSSLTIEQKQETILHEIIHGIEYFMNMDFEEDEVKLLGKGLSMVFKDNPELLNYLKENVG